MDSFVFVKTRSRVFPIINLKSIQVWAIYIITKIQKNVNSLYDIQDIVCFDIIRQHPCCLGNKTPGSRGYRGVNMMCELRSTTVGTQIFIVQGTDLAIHHDDLINLLVHAEMSAKPVV